MHVSSVSPPCLFSLIAFEIRCNGRVLLVLGSRLKKDRARGILGVQFHCMSTVSSRLTLKERGKHARFPLFLLHDYFH